MVEQPGCEFVIGTVTVTDRFVTAFEDQFVVRVEGVFVESDGRDWSLADHPNSLRYHTPQLFLHVVIYPNHKPLYGLFRLLVETVNSLRLSTDVTKTVDASFECLDRLQHVVVVVALPLGFVQELILKVHLTLPVKRAVAKLAFVSVVAVVKFERTKFVR